MPAVGSSPPPGDGEAVTVTDDAVGEGAGSPSPAMLVGSRNKCPGPGDYVWRDDVHLNKHPEWSLAVPERKNLDLMVGSWFPPPSSNAERAPDPSAYGDLSHLGRNGKFGAPKWSWEKCSTRPCLQKATKDELGKGYDLPSSVGGRHPLKKNRPTWSVFGKDRSLLPHDIPSWTPQSNSDLKPGPNAYLLDRKKWTVTTRRGCTFGGRPVNLPTGIPGWTPETFGSRFRG